MEEIIQMSVAVDDKIADDTATTVDTPSKPTICICMIVKNEEKRLPACLESLKGFYDKLVIVDTGSTDRTMEIAEEYGADLYEHEWHDFSDARNVSFSYADPDCEWTGIIDADEELEPVDFFRIYNAMMTPDIGSIIIQVLHDRPSGWSMQPMERFIRTGTGHYVGLKHNQLVTDNKRLYIPARLYHYGYNLPPKEAKAKYERDIKLLDMELAEDPDNVYTLRNYIMSYMSMGKYEEVIVAAEALLAREGELKFTELSLQITLINLGRSYGAVGKTEKSIATLTRLANEFPGNIDAMFYLAQILFSNDDFAGAVGYYEEYIKALSLAKNGLTLQYTIIESWGLAWQAYNNMSICYAAIDKTAQALEAMKIATLQAVEGQFDRVVKFFRQTLRKAGG